MRRVGVTVAWSVAYLVRVRYPDGGGLTAEGRARREAVRLQAAALSAEGVPVVEIARRLRVSHNSVYVWRRRWLADGEAGLVSKGKSGSDCRLSDAQLEALAAALDEGPAAFGYVEDQRWTLARIAELIARMFRQRYTLRGVSCGTGCCCCCTASVSARRYRSIGRWNGMRRRSRRGGWRCGRRQNSGG